MSDSTDPPAPEDAHAAGSAIEDIKERLRQLSQPLVDSLDARLAPQIDAYLDAHLAQRVEDLVAARLTVLERALADLDRQIHQRGEDAES